MSECLPLSVRNSSAVRADRTNPAKQQAFLAKREDLGFGLLTLKYVDDPAKADERVIEVYLGR